MQAKTLNLTCGETVKVRSNWAAECEKRDTTISASAWEATAGAVSGAALDTPVATATLAVGSCGQIKNTATLANGEVLVRWWQIDARSNI